MQVEGGAGSGRHRDQEQGVGTHQLTNVHHHGEWIIHMFKHLAADHPACPAMPRRQAGGSIKFPWWNWPLGHLIWDKAKPEALMSIPRISQVGNAAAASLQRSPCPQPMSRSLWGSPVVIRRQMPEHQVAPEGLRRVNFRRGGAIPPEDVPILVHRRPFL